MLDGTHIMSVKNFSADKMDLVLGETTLTFYNVNSSNGINNVVGTWTLDTNPASTLTVGDDGGVKHFMVLGNSTFDLDGYVSYQGTRNEYLYTENGVTGNYSWYDWEVVGNTLHYTNSDGNTVTFTRKK